MSIEVNALDFTGSAHDGPEPDAAPAVAFVAPPDVEVADDPFSAEAERALCRRARMRSIQQIEARLDAGIADDSDFREMVRQLVALNRLALQADREERLRASAAPDASNMHGVASAPAGRSEPRAPASGREASADATPSEPRAPASGRAVRPSDDDLDTRAQPPTPSPSRGVGRAEGPGANWQNTTYGSALRTPSASERARGPHSAFDSQSARITPSPAQGEGRGEGRCIPARHAPTPRRPAHRQPPRQHPRVEPLGPDLGYGYRTDGTPVTREDFLATLNRALKRVYDLDMPPNYAGVPDATSRERPAGHIDDEPPRSPEAPAPDSS
jgi:hypothetical protein